MDYSKRKYAVYVKAVKPVYTLQLMFSEKPSEEEAVADALNQFDARWPNAKDRKLDRVLPYDDYLEEVRIADQLNYLMST